MAYEIDFGMLSRAKIMRINGEESLYEWQTQKHRDQSQTGIRTLNILLRIHSFVNVYGYKTLQSYISLTYNGLNKHRITSNAFILNVPFITNCQLSSNCWVRMHPNIELLSAMKKVKIIINYKFLSSCNISLYTLISSKEYLIYHLTTNEIARGSYTIQKTTASSRNHHIAGTKVIRNH